MDKYLDAIKKDEVIKTDLTVKKEKLERRREQIKENKIDLEYRNMNNKNQLEEAFRLRYYHQNKDSCKTMFFKKALKFGLKCIAGSIIMSIIFIIAVLNMDPSYILDIKSFIQGNLAIGALMVIVEYLNVGRDFNSLITKRNAKSNETFIENIEMEIIENQALINELELKLGNLDIDIKEIEEALGELGVRILGYRTNRNNLIDSLINELDNHIVSFEYQEFDNNKVKKRTKK